MVVAVAVVVVVVAVATVVVSVTVVEEVVVVAMVPVVASFYCREVWVTSKFGQLSSIPVMCMTHEVQRMLTISIRMQSRS